jgi:hypothetical protein
MTPIIRVLLCSSLLLTTSWAQTAPSPPAQDSEDYLSWSAQQATDVGKAWRAGGRVGGYFDMRVVHTEHAYNYKLRGTLMTPEAIRAAARLEQLRGRLSDEQTRALVAEADVRDRLVVMVELDAREGSGVIPLDWRASILPKGAKADSPSAVAGVNTPSLRRVKALAGVARRDYAYDIFWVVFPLTNDKGEPSMPPTVTALDLVVGIYNKEGRVSWQLPESLRQRLKTLTNNQK